jgi:hypothetical protein
MQNSERPPVTPSNRPGASPAHDTLSVKQKRTAQRAKKLEEFHRQEKKATRNRRLGLIGGITAGVAVIGLIVTVVVTTPQAPSSASYAGGGTDAVIDGVETFNNGALHVDTAVTYPETPPTGGDHNPGWLNCGVYTEPVPNENAVHSLEHGAIWVTYDPATSADELETLRAFLPSTFVIMSPFEGLPSPVVLSGWNVQLQLDSVTDERIPEFFEAHWKSNTVPEPGALCTSGVSAPGLV